MKAYSILTGTVVFCTTLLMTACTVERAAKAPMPAAVVVEVSHPQKRSSGAVQVSGQLEPSSTAVISTRMMGFVTRVLVKPGDKVSRGQLLVTINSADIKAKHAQTQAMVAEAEVALGDAQKDFERYTELLDQQSASKKEWENMRLRYESMKSRALVAQQAEQEARSMLTYVNITAPFPGVVTQKFVSEGSMASPGMPLLSVEQQGSWQAITSVSEAEIGNIHTGDGADVVVKSTGQLLKGEVSEISPSANQRGRYAVKITMPPLKDLYSGMHVTVSISASRDLSPEQTILVPAKALVYRDQLVGIYTISENNTALLRWLKTGRSFNENIEVLAGLREDEPFISSSEGKLYNGVPIVSR